MRALSQAAQRTTVPISVTYVIASPTCATVPQLTQAASAEVISNAKISPRVPPAAFPSNLFSFIFSLTSCWSEAFGLHTRGVVPELHERRRHRLDQRRGAAHEDARTLLRRRGDLL